MSYYEETIAEIKEDEGFEPKPYKDHLGKLTIGFGTLLESGITREEAHALLMLRLNKVKKQLEDINMFNKLSENRKSVILSMCYQLGFNGVLKFKKMWQAIDSDDYIEAVAQMRDSKWFSQTTNRANRLMAKMKTG